MRKLGMPFAAALVALVVSVTAYADDRTGVFDDKIVVGVPGTFTGPNASFGAIQIGLLAYYKWINDQGGVHGRKIETIVGDTVCNEAKGVAVAKKFIYQDKVFLINGNDCSGVALAMKPDIVEAGTPWVLGSGVNQKISYPTVKNIFHATPTSLDAGNGLAEYVMTKPGAKKIAIITHTNEWAKGYADPVKELLQAKHGLQPAVEVSMERGETDSTAQTLRLKQANADFIIALLYEPELAIFLRDRHKYGLTTPVLAALGSDFLNTLNRVKEKDIVKGHYNLYRFVDQIDSATLKPWADMIKKYYPNETVTEFHFNAIPSGMVVVEVLKRIGRDLTREKFIETLDNIRGFKSNILMGEITFTPQVHAGVKGFGAVGLDDKEEVTVFSKYGVAYKK